MKLTHLYGFSSYEMTLCGKIKGEIEDNGDGSATRLNVSERLPRITCPDCRKQIIRYASSHWPEWDEVCSFNSIRVSE